MRLVIGRAHSLHPGDRIHTAWLEDGRLHNGWATVTGAENGRGVTAVELQPLNGSDPTVIALPWDTPIVVAI